MRPRSSSLEALKSPSCSVVGLSIGGRSAWGVVPFIAGKRRKMASRAVVLVACVRRPAQLATTDQANVDFCWRLMAIG